MSTATRTARRTADPVAFATASFPLPASAGILAPPYAFAGVPGRTRAADRNSDFDGCTDILTGVPEGTWTATATTTRVVGGLSAAADATADADTPDGLVGVQGPSTAPQCVLDACVRGPQGSGCSAQMILPLAV
ncbi:hypothetical protein J2Z21_002970 [Streptomyces griseochromogenes]|uniref:DUF4189 domain-containing protein n=1 Tax=Streptomyces griseochromogenes TaxID=68214 RepID=A0A1B1AXM2_9ACTN|nr:hypothetical protein [Streptomyces griseochromogenes]ANP51277.1 hypothetical protein AVL59_18080 [Streptomyces griseochromogenes]MBP2050034.1 hypothetical protein [Streptomyces griseochromogenes]